MKTFAYAIWIHIISGMLILVATFIMSLIAIKKVDGEVEPEFHTILGVIILAFVGFINVTGLITKLRVFRILPINWIHKISGMVVLMASQIAIVSGVVKYAKDFLSDRSPLGFIHIGIFAFIWIALEIRH